MDDPKFCEKCWELEKYCECEDGIISYLNNILDQIFKKGKDPQIFLLALRNLVCTKDDRNMTWLSKKTGLGRESLYKTLSEKGNPKWSTIFSICYAMGLKIRIKR
jgi:probable addiction module antidote protein